MLSVIPRTALNATSNAIVTDSASTTWGEILRESESLSQSWGSLAHCRVGIDFQVNGSSFAALIALENLACDVFLLPNDLSEQARRDLGDSLQLGAIVQPPSPASQKLQVIELGNESPRSDQSSVTILTSGTTGKPKAARHTWAGLARPTRMDPAHPSPRWLLTYRPNLYAGIQVILQCFVNGGTLVCPRPGADAEKVARLALAAKVQFASATPSYWRWLLTFAENETLKRIRPIQITLGGEIVHQPILDALRACFPSARIVHIYATTELGRCFSVSDGKAGFSVAYLDKPTPDNIEMRIDENELTVRSPNAMRGYDTLSTQVSPPRDFFRTGDLVEVVEDRVYFVGRETDIINVGGNKVHPAQVEGVIQSVPGVSDVRVYAKASSLAGQLVACDFVIENGRTREDVLNAVRSTCLERLLSYQRPRMFEIVDEISLSQASKKMRAASP